MQFDGIVTDLRLVHPSNVLLSIFVSPVESFTEARFSHDMNAFDPIDVTVFGIDMLSRPHLSVNLSPKQLSPMVLSFEGSLMLRRDVQPANALSQRDVTALCKVTVLRDVHPANIAAGTCFMCEGSVNSSSDVQSAKRLPP